MGQRSMHAGADAPYAGLFGVGGIGTGLFFALDGDHTLGRNESRPARLLDVRDYCKLHIIAHYAAVMLGAAPDGPGFHVLPIGKVGQDNAGRAMLEEMARAGMDVRSVWAIKELPTTFSVCFQYPDGSGGNITTSDSAAAALTPEDVERGLGMLRGPAKRYMALAAPEVPLELRAKFLESATRVGAFRAACLTSADAVDEQRHAFLRHADLVAMNEDEAAALIGCPFPAGDPRPFLDQCAAALGSYRENIMILLSAGELGAFAFDGQRWNHRAAVKVPVASSAGAGDALLGGMLAGLALGIPLAVSRAWDPPRPVLETALDFGVVLASYTVTSPHTIHPGACLESVAGFARENGFRFSGALEKAVQENS